jgi:hypothetical protein
MVDDDQQAIDLLPVQTQSHYSALHETQQPDSCCIATQLTRERPYATVRRRSLGGLSRDCDSVIARGPDGLTAARRYFARV